jgi:hypothetical protein
MAGKKKTKKGGNKPMYLLLALLSVFLALPLTAQASDLSWGLADVPTRVSAGYTLSGGLDDPGEAGAIGLNNVLSVVNESLTIPGFVVSYKDQRILELGVLSGGYSGATGADATAEDGGFAFLGLGAYLLEGLSWNVIYVLDGRAESQFMAFASVDVAKLGPKLVSLTSAAWGKTGL